MAEQRSTKQCFIISPIGADDSDIRRAADFFRKDIVQAALSPEFSVRRADDYNKAGNITSQVIQAIAKADLIVADLSGRNPNVYYELGFAHTYERYVVPMINIDDENPLPFDNYTERTIRYSFRNVQDREASMEALRRAAKETLGEPVSNPVTTALGLAKATAAGDDAGQLLANLVNLVSTISVPTPSWTGSAYRAASWEPLSCEVRHTTDVRQPERNGGHRDELAEFGQPRF